MKKIEKEMIAAINDGKDYKKSNTIVEHSAKSVFVYLHDNLICVINKSSGARMYNLRGWNTVTTRSRLNALGAGIKSRNGRVLYCDGSPLNYAPCDMGNVGYFYAKN